MILNALSQLHRKLCSLRCWNPDPIEKHMEDDKISDNLESEEIPESFLCCVCLELLYKPVVLACGHISCFWCIHKSMKGYDKSHCPLCRHSYYHFPTICQMLHLLISKMYPIAYETRAQQIIEKEKEMKCFSPQFDVYSSPASCTNHLANQPTFSINNSPPDSSSRPCLTENEKPCLYLDQSKPNFNKIGRQISISDVMCPACMELMFRPVVLNCGHVFCETCLVLPADGLLRCFVCQSPDPRGTPKVCLMLKNILEEHFPKQYALNRDVAVEQGSRNAGEDGINSPSLPDGKSVHYGVGCDSCGIYPVIGDRYQCKDCVESIGFDLCGDCYKSELKVPGRFNQHHSAEHRFSRIQDTAQQIRVVGPFFLVVPDEDTTLHEVSGFSGV